MPWQQLNNGWYWYEPGATQPAVGPYISPPPDNSRPDPNSSAPSTTWGTAWGVKAGGYTYNPDTQQWSGGAAPASSPSAPAPPAAAPGTSPADQSAKAFLNSFLGQYGLSGLGNWAWQKYLEGEPVEQIMLEMRSTPEYKQRFPAMEALAQKGHAISEQQYVDYERNAAQIFSYAGLAQFATPAYLTSVIAGEVSLDELQDRIRNGYERVIEAPPEVRQQFQEWFGPNGDAALAGWFLDANHTEPFIKDAVATAQAGGYGKFFGFNQITQAGAHLIGQIAPTAQELISGYQKAIEFKPLTFETISENTDLTQDQTVEAAFGTGGTALEAFRKRLEERASQGRGGGGFLESQQGLTGAGESGQ